MLALKVHPQQSDDERDGDEQQDGWQRHQQRAHHQNQQRRRHQPRDQDHQDEAERDRRRAPLCAGRDDLRLRARFFNWRIWPSV